MHDTRRLIALSLVAAFALVFTFGLGGVTSYVLFQPQKVQGSTTPRDNSANGNPTSTTGANANSGDLDAQMQTFNEVMKLVQEEYYGRPVDTRKMVYAATKAAVASLGDPVTMYVEPVTNEMLSSDMRGNFEGIGANV